MAVGEYLYREGDPAYDFYVVLSGLVEIFITADGEERLIARRGPGDFLGELNLISGQTVFLTAVVTKPKPMKSGSKFRFTESADPNQGSRQRMHRPGIDQMGLAMR